MGTKQKTTKQFGLLALIVAVIVAPMVVQAVATAAPTYSSPNYGVDEVFMGAGGTNDMSSTNYQGRASLGDTGVGNSASANYQAYAGFTTTGDPVLEFVVNAATVDLGVLSTSSANTGTATFTVRTYLANGYVVSTQSDSLQNGSYTIPGINLPGAGPSNPGTEQFGINLVANTSPTTLGADPVQLPDATYSYGQAASGYDTPNNYKYVKGDTIAYSTKSSGITQYTISYLVNIKSSTPGGIYTMTHNLVATSTF